MDSTGLGSCWMAYSGIVDAEPSSSVCTLLVEGHTLFGFRVRWGSRLNEHLSK
jgi:hypothetical protein